MKKVLLLLSVMGFVGCGSYTLKNNWGNNVKSGGTLVEPGECVSLSDAFLFGVFPITITDESDGDLPNAKKDAPYEAGHWVVTTDGAVSSSNEACEVGKGKPPKKDGGEEEQKEVLSGAELEKVLEQLRKLDAIDDTELSGDDFDELQDIRYRLEEQLTPEQLKAYENEPEPEQTQAGGETQQAGGETQQAGGETQQAGGETQQAGGETQGGTEQGQ